MKILGLVPARGGSKGIPGKNIKLLGGKPLLQYTVGAAKNSRLLTRLILSSDDPEIVEAALQLGLEVPFLRPASLAQDDTGSLEVILHALEQLEAGGATFDAVCLLQPTTPFRKPGLIDAAIEKFLQSGADSLISVRQVPDDYNPHWTFLEKEGSLQIATGDKQIISRRQDLPKAFHRDGAIYLTRTEVLRQQNSLYGSRIDYIDVTGQPYVNIDTPSDWEAAEEFLRSKS